MTPRTNIHTLHHPTDESQVIAFTESEGGVRVGYGNWKHFDDTSVYIKVKYRQDPLLGEMFITLRNYIIHTMTIEDARTMWVELVKDGWVHRQEYP